MTDEADKTRAEGSALKVFAAFLKLGCISFGGPIAHIGYFRREFVERRRWIREEQFAHLLAVCQFLPGPASSQLGFGIGLLRAGWSGALAAFIAFTLPSALLLLLFAAALPSFQSLTGQAVIHGLKLVALAVVAHAVLGMWQTLCPDGRRRLFACITALILLGSHSILIQPVVVLIAGLAGAWLLKRPMQTGDPAAIRISYGKPTGSLLLSVFFGLLIALPLVAGSGTSLADIAHVFYHSGALVFGGGHVVLPLLEESVVTPGWISAEQFLAGYGATQAMPGPLFAFSAYLGATMSSPGAAVLAAGTALVFIFLPGFLLLCGVLPFWQELVRKPVAANAIAGVNAAVVGLLVATLYDPIFTSSVTDWLDLAIAIAGFALLFTRQASPLIVVLWCVVASLLKAAAM